MTTVEALPREEAQLLEQLADGLDVLIRFHDREVDAALVEEMARHKVAEGLLELLISESGQEAAQGFRGALAALGACPGTDALDHLAANYADLYLTHGYRAAPNGSVWLTEDKLERQQPMFEVRDWYAHYDITVPDWRTRADDHLVHELQFVSFLCRSQSPVAAVDAGRFLDLHVLPWVPDFCDRAEARVQAPLYAGLMALTRAYLQELRRVLETVTGVPRQIRKPAGEASPPKDAPYLPGTAESW